MTTDPLLRDIEAAMDLYGFSATRLGYLAVGDPAFVGRLRAGRRMRQATRDKVAAWLRQLDEENAR